MKYIGNKTETRDKILLGINELADTVSSTLGAAGQLVIYEEDIRMGNQISKGFSRLTKDGVTVARHIQFSDPVKNLGAQMVKQAAEYTVIAAGDGTTTSTLLAQTLTNQVFDYEVKSSLRDFLRGIESAKEDVLKLIELKSEQVTDEKLKDVAYISANNDEKIGGLIADAFIQGGDHVFVTADRSPNRDTYIEIEHGIKIESGWMDSTFVNDEESRRFIADKPLIFISNAPIENTKQLVPILEVAVKENRPLLIIANVDPKVAAPLAVNMQKGNITVNIIRPPANGALQKELLEDLAVATGATLHGLHLGDAANVLNGGLLGEADYVFSDSGNTVLRIDKNEKIDERVKMLQNYIKKEENHEGRKKTLERRLANLAGALGVIYVGGDSKTDQEEVLHRVDDAIRAVYSARLDGILPGGGIALKNAAEELEKDAMGATEQSADFMNGYSILLSSIKRPFQKILENAKIPYEGVELQTGEGIDAITGEIINMKEAGVLDPTLVVKQSLVNSTSVALQLANVSSSIVWENETDI